MLTQGEIVRLVNLANHEAGFCRYRDDVIFELVERLHRGESVFTWEVAKIDEDDLQMALDLYRSESF